MNQVKFFLNDLSLRPKKYLSDVVVCAAAWFAAGNTLFAYSTGAFAGLQLSGAIAAFLQLCATFFIILGQVSATYRGATYSTPFTRLGHVNALSATIMLLSGASYLQWTQIQPLLLPIITLYLWAAGQYKMGAVRDFEELIAKATDEEKVKIEGAILRGTKLAIIFYGLADISAVTSTAASINLMLPILGCLLATALFIAGLWRSLLPNSETDVSADVGKIPFLLYAAGYLIQGVTSVVAPIAVGYNLCWARAYYCLTIRVKREGADFYPAESHGV